MYTLKSVTKKYMHRGEEIFALDNISLDIPKGHFVTVTGPSGSGKTTLLLTLGGLINPTSGNVSVKGDDLYTLGERHLAEYRNRTVGFVLQTFHLVPYLTAMDNVMLPLLISEKNPSARVEKAIHLLDKVGLSDRKQFLPKERSVGQQQRVAIARSLANDPEIILADEPTGNLDPCLSLEILDILDGLNKDEGKTIIMVTHSPAAAEYGHQRFHLIEGALSENNASMDDLSARRKAAN